MNALDQSTSEHNTRVLILEDEESHAEALRRAFAASGWTSVEVIATLALFRARPAAQAPELLLADLFVIDGEATELLHAPAEEQPYPIIVMTSHGNERKAVEVLKAGAFDYVVKSPETFAEMPRTLARILREWALVQERKQSLIEREALQRQLAQAQKMQAIGQLAGGIAHDFNNILASILGYTNLALTRYVPDPQSKLSEYLTQVKIAGERARDLVTSMLAVTRLSSSKASHLDAANTVREVVQLLRPIIASSVQLETHIAPHLPKVLMDATRLHQVLMNLCLNARDAVSEHGSIDVSLDLLDVPPAVCSACNAPLQGRWLVLSVRDNGSGMAPGTIARMFDPFYSTKAVGLGTGLGLSMVHRFAHEAGGHILVDSTPNQGTTMQILLPPLNETASADSCVEISQLLITGKGQRVLIVDDEVVVAHLLGETLSTYGYAPQVFTDSKLALAFFEADPARFDAVITDYTMPGLTGGKLASALLARRPGLPILLCTGYTDKLNKESATQLGIAHFLNKPISIEHLLTVLADVLP